MRGQFEIGPTSNFKGLMFLKFPTHTEASAALSILRQCISKENVEQNAKSRLWCDFKKPVEAWICGGFLGGFKTQLVEWKYTKQSVSYTMDAGAGVLKFENKEVLRVAIVQGEFRVVWLDDRWAHWEDLQKPDELKGLLRRAQEKLAQMKAHHAKGAGKGQ